MLISKLYRQMYANTGIATDSARVSRSAQWARLIAKHTRRLFVAPPMPELDGAGEDGAAARRPGAPDRHPDDESRGIDLVGLRPRSPAAAACR